MRCWSSATSSPAGGTLGCASFAACPQAPAPDEYGDLEGAGLFFVIDRSGSMGQGEFVIAKREVRRFLCVLAEPARFGLVLSDNQVVTFPAGGHAAVPTPQELAAAAAFLDAARISSGSCPLEALLAALAMARSSGASRNLVVYLSDGGATCRGQAEREQHAATIEELTRENAGFAEVHTVGILMVDQARYHEEFLQTLAAENGGTYRRVN
jgi:Mg-chelatase subunit ChlD